MIEDNWCLEGFVEGLSSVSLDDKKSIYNLTGTQNCRILFLKSRQSRLFYYGERNMKVQELKEFCETIKPIKLSVTKNPEELRFKEALLETTKFLDVYPKKVPLVLRYYCVLNDVMEIPKCICGNPVVYKKDAPAEGFGQFCSPKCSRSNKYSDKPYQEFINDKDWLYNQKITLGKSKEQIAKELGCSTVPITKRLKEFGIEQRQENIKNTKIDIPPVEELKWLYFDEGWNLTEIGHKYDASNVTAKKWFNHYGIELESFYDKIVYKTFKKYGIDKEMFSDHEFLEEICKDSTYFKVSREYFNNMPIMTILRHFSRIEFDPKFSNNRSSMGELEVADYIKSLGFDILQRDRKTIPGLELDIHVPSKKFAVEFNGLYYHNTDEFRHYNKMLEAQIRDIFLIQIFEDEWYNKMDLVKSIINVKLNLCDRIYARNTKVMRISPSAAYKFFGNNHIQGFCGGENYYGLIYNDEIVSAAVVGKNRFKKNTKELIRYCNKLNLSVVGGFSKLLSAIKQDYDEIYTYCNLRYFDGEVYSKVGKFIGISEPGYSWADCSKVRRISRFRTEHQRLADFLGDKFKAEWTEDENMFNAGYLKIFDCGNKIFIL